jgi:glycosyltransferase involved in cell wall biosynthesis
MTPAITLLVPCYNAAAFLPRLWETVRAQMRPFDELLCYDDASTDNTVAVARALGATVICGERNAGPAFARNDLRGRDAFAVPCVHYKANGTVVHPAFTPPKFLFDFKGSALVAMFSFISSGYGIGLANRQRIFADGLFG